MLDGDPAPPLKKGGTTPIFGPCLLWPNGWIDEDATWHGSSPRPRPHCIRRVPAPRERGTAAPPLFGACLMWPRSPISASAELLFYYRCKGGTRIWGSGSSGGNRSHQCCSGPISRLVICGRIYPEAGDHLQIIRQLQMWANAQRDGRPAEYRWRPLFNAAKFG